MRAANQQTMLLWRQKVKNKPSQFLGHTNSILTLLINQLLDRLLLADWHVSVVCLYLNIFIGRPTDFGRECEDKNGRVETTE